MHQPAAADKGSNSSSICIKYVVYASTCLILSITATRRQRKTFFRIGCAIFMHFFSFLCINNLEYL